MGGRVLVSILLERFELIGWIDHQSGLSKAVRNLRSARFSARSQLIVNNSSWNWIEYEYNRLLLECRVLYSTGLLLKVS